jgi:multidrug efflux system membrane fusion protein
MRDIREESAKHSRGGILLVIAVATGAFIYWTVIRHRPEAPHGDLPVAVATARVSRTNLVLSLTEIGAAQAWQSVTIRAQVSGRLKRVAAGEGADVKMGDLIAEIDSAPFKAALTQAQGALHRDKAQLDIARLDLQRYTRLVEQDSIASQQLDAQKSLEKQLEGTVLIDQGAVAAAQVNVDYCQIHSPVTGRVGVRLVDAGNLVSPVDAGGIVTINQMAPMAVTFAVPESELPRISEASAGFSRALETQAFSQDTGELLGTGEVTIADNHVDPATGTVQLKARFANQDRRLWPGQFVNVKLVLAALTQVRSVPASAINHGPDRTYVYVIGAGNTAEIRDVTVTLVQDAQAVIASGLEDGQTVVTDGQMALRPGMNVLARDAAAAAQGGSL